VPVPELLSGLAALPAGVRFTALLDVGGDAPDLTGGGVDLPFWCARPAERAPMRSNLSRLA